ncbi:hypothetical protein [Pseudomonas mediterranea]|uniref:hypothetical protein n=1 Tax=Pseudomonas mediterranea TaxID=183795 RepID=UPI0006D8BF03|nr:hypothetical protein [Pseudomonas mediterranea]
MSDDTDFDSAFAEATDVEVDTQQTPPQDAAGGDAGTPPADTKDPVEPAAAEPAADAGEPADAETPEAKAAAAEVAAAEKKDLTEPVAKPEAVVPPVQAPAAQQPLDPKFLAQAMVEAQQLAEKNKPAPAAAPAKPLVAEDFLTDDDKKAIETFKSEWPTEHTAINKLYDAKIKAELGNYKTQLIADLNVVLAPLYQSVGTVQANSHTGTIKAAHPDADAIAPAVVEWVKTQPSYSQVGMMEVLQKGNAAQVVELLNDYKKTLAPPGAAPVTPAPVVENKGPATKKAGVDPAAVAALAAVPAAQRPTPAARPSDNDFDAAFDEALAQA